MTLTRHNTRKYENDGAELVKETNQRTDTNTDANIT